MAQYAQDFNTQAQSLLSYVQGQLAQVTSWTALPGQLNKISASSGGYVWGVNAGGSIYMCKEPCDGSNWTSVAGPSGISGTPIDIATDDQNVYLLFNGLVPSLTGTWNVNGPNYSSQVVQTGSTWTLTPSSTSSGWSSVTGTFDPGSTNSGSLVFKSTGGHPNLTFRFTIDSGMTTINVSNGGSFSRSGAGGGTPQLSFSSQPVDGSGSWSAMQQVPGVTATTNPTISITDQFIFVGSQGCSKPCTTGSWVPVSQPSGAKGVVAASSGNTYSLVTTPNGNQDIYKSTANGQGGWTKQDGLSGITPVAVGADSTFILGVDPVSQKVSRCTQPYTDPSSCSPEDTDEHTAMPGPHSLSVNPKSYQTYLAASQSGASGNIYQRLDQGNIDHSAVINQAKQYATQMDSDVNALGSAVSSQQARVTAAAIRAEAGNAIAQITDLSGDIQDTEIERENLRRKIETMGGPADAWKMLVLKYITIVLAVVVVLYLILGFFVSPLVNMTIAIVGVLIGIGLAIYFAVNRQ